VFVAMSKQVSVEDLGGLPAVLRAAVEEMQWLRKNVDRAEAALFLRAHEIEREHRAVWREHFATFDLLLEKFFICDAVRYREFIVAQADKTVAAAAPTIGVPSTIQAFKIADPARRAKFVEAAATRVAETGAQWSDQQARLERLKIGGAAPRDSKWNGVAGETKKLKQEIIDLKRRVHELEKENKELLAENERLKKKAGKSREKAA